MINDLKELKALLSLCRKQGVTEINVGECHVKFGDMQKHEDTKDDLPPVERSFDELSEEERMFYSAEGTQA